ncbi:hypothetical protein SLNSH_20480 [Alsobacter soli]|uniref:O-antigen ligase-related domain-containing protein n=1 Tax=Alsobacter soli TaxID=2109933 RepID=A0A2T1HNE0_9HYPH|nr:O-antigen ligase family protein [Alsobacter soli]PSC03111.1 hypothetical protein SLNSH_20480 [Alsobacter soli]
MSYAMARRRARPRWMPSLETVCLLGSITCLIFVPHMGNVAAAGFVGGTLALLALSRTNPLEPFFATTAPWLFTGWILASSLWSTDSGFTFYEGLQYFFTCYAGAVLAQTVEPRRLVAAIAAGSLPALVMSATSGIYGVDERGVVSLVGIFNSKNFLAYYATIGLLASLATLCDRRQPLPPRLAAAATAVVAVYIILAARSLGTLVAGFMAAGVLLGLVFIFRLSVLARSLIIAIGLMAGLAVALAGVLYTDQVLELLGKDSSLTGRSFLWARGWQYIEMRPVFGTGYYNFWKQGSVEAEGLWRQMNIGSRTGFHFHNIFINAGVELGYVGMALITVMVLAAWRGIIKWLARDLAPHTAFFAAFMVYSLPRLFIEVDIPSIYGWGPVLIFYICTHAGLLLKRAADPDIGEALSASPMHGASLSRRP